MDKWPYELQSWSAEQIQQFCVENEAWQMHRRRMKGKPTSDKLRMLDWWRSQHAAGDNTLLPVHQCQIDNYINALKRGGQLNMDLTIKRN